MTKRRGPAQPSEADLERAARDFLALDGWRALKTDPVSRRDWAKGFGELGMADSLYIRYGYGAKPGFGPGDALAELMWIEWKTPKGSMPRAPRMPRTPLCPILPDGRVTREHARLAAILLLLFNE